MKNLLKITFTLIFTTILLLGFAVQLNPAGNWYQQFFPNLNNEPISDIFFIDSLTGFAITGDGLPNDSNYILKTTNGGDNWEIKHTAYRDFFRIKFINSSTGFACGGFNTVGGGLYKSINGGENWSQINSPSIIEFRDMAVLNNDTMWLVDDESSSGGVFRTTNGGTNWQNQLNVGSLNPTNIYFYDKDTGFVAENVLYKTTNSGVNWIQIPTGAGFSDMYFVNGLTGWKCYGPMQKTTDGGLNWINQLLPSGGNIGVTQITKFSILNKDTIWGVGGIYIAPTGLRGMIYRTINGGDNWLFQVPDTAIHISQYSFCKFLNKRIGWAYVTFSGIHTTNEGDPVWLTPIQQVSSQVPLDHELFQNYPNPFNPKTNIKYSVKRHTSNVKLIVYDIQGKLITELLNQKQTAGVYETDFSGSNYSSGIYFYSLIIDGDVIDTKKMILLK